MKEKFLAFTLLGIPAPPFNGWKVGDNDNSATTGANGGKFNRTAFGLRHAF